MTMRMADGDSTSLVDRFNSLLALLRLPVQLPLLRLATPTLLLTVLEAILETRIVDVPAEWRADSDPATRLKVVQYLLRAIQQVTLGIATRTGSVPPSEAKVEQLEPRKVVGQDEQSLETILEVLLWIADALDIKSRPQPPSSQRQRTVRVLKSSPPPPDDPETYSRAAPGSMQGKLFSRQSPTQPPLRPLRTALSDTSSPSKDRLATTHKRPPSAAASEPGPLPQLERSASPPPPLRSGPPPSTPTRRDRLATATTTSFLAELARARSPAQASVSSSHTSIEGDAARSPPTSPRKSIVEVMRSLELRRTEQAYAATGVNQRRKRSPPRGGPQDPDLLKPAESAHPFTARSGTKLYSHLATSPPLPPRSSSSSSTMSTASGLSSRPPSNRKTARRRSRSKEADGRLPNGGSTIDPLPPCTCTCAVVETLSPSRHPHEGTPAVPSASPPSPAPPSRHPRERSRSGSATWPSSSPASSTPTSKRTPPPHRIRVSRISPTTLHATPAANNTPTSAAGLLSVHSSTDLDLDSPPPCSRPPPRPSATAEPYTTPLPPRQGTRSYGATGQMVETPSPYTLLLLAHRDRLREKLRILERRERDRKAAAAMVVGSERQTVVPLPGGGGPGMTAGITV